MKYLFLIILICLVCLPCSAQSKYQFVDSTRTFTTTIDTLIVSTQYNESFVIMIYNSGTDTLLWRTDVTTKWNVLPPKYEYFNPTIIMQNLYRKAKNTSTTANASGS